MKTTETVTLPLFFCFFSSGVAVLFSTTFCAEMQCRFFFAVFISFQCFICAVIFHRVIFVCSLCRYICDFVSFVKVFNMQLQGVLGIFQQRSCAEMQCRCLCSFHQFSMFCLHSNFSLCNFCLLVVQLLLDFVLCGSFCVFVCKLSGGCREKYHGWAVCLFQLFVLCSGFVA